VKELRIPASDVSLQIMEVVPSHDGSRAVAVSIPGPSPKLAYKFHHGVLMRRGRDAAFRSATPMADDYSKGVNHGSKT
jgi:hypothetical protein